MAALPRTDMENRPMTAEERKVIIASSAGTVFEWYDFYLYGSLAAIIGAKFFSQYPETTRNIFALLAFAAGFLVRPFGALVFGRLGDMVGRKYTFLITILIMGSSTFIVGLLPTSDQIGVAAPIILIILRLLQGLALGGEYGGAATYVAEHAPHGRRGFYTSWIQTTATAGLFMSLLVILITQTITGSDFAVWGWRVPFVLSIVLLAISVWIRLQLNESPAFQKMKEEGTHSTAPLTEAFGRWSNAKWALLALLGMVAGQAVVWYGGQFYALFFLTSTMKVDSYSANLMVAWSLALGTGGFILFGWLSDKIGRKPIILGGCILAAVIYFPMFHMLAGLANPALTRAQDTVKVEVVADPNNCSFQFNPTGTSKFTTACDIVKATLARLSVRYDPVDAPAGTIASVKIGDRVIEGFDARTAGAEAAAQTTALTRQITEALTAAGYPPAANPSVAKLAHPFDVFRPQTGGIVILLTVLVLLVTMVYGPIAAALVELFPTRIRYTSMSLPYHIGNGWFGGFLPATVFAMNAAAGSPYFGLWYPVVVAAGTAIIGLIFLPETKDRDIFAEDTAPR
ncbi:MAG: MFS transporter [Acetobacteraceae bacterium]